MAQTCKMAYTVYTLLAHSSEQPTLTYELKKVLALVKILEYQLFEGIDQNLSC